MTEKKDPAEIPWDDLAWIESTPLGERYKVAMAPRGVVLNRQPEGGGDLGAELVGFIAQGAAALARGDGTWKIGVFRAKSFQVRRCVFKRTGLSQEQAEQEVQRLRSCGRRGDLSWSQA